MMQMRILDMQIAVSLGVYAHEQQVRYIPVTLTYKYDASAAIASDNIEETIDYETLASKVREVASLKHYNLAETLVDAIGKVIVRMNGIEEVTVQVVKPEAVAGAECIIAEATYKP